jgi:hypothetical protein
MLASGVKSNKMNDHREKRQGTTGLIGLVSRAQGGTYRSEDVGMQGSHGKRLLSTELDMLEC